ncbi:hypothetical protein B0H13DRAFT_1901553 [Mycena leptocephala]|nr:hypothetical protein B0H13DRAFT_1901553 [Mycena leptocephala]
MCLAVSESTLVKRGVKGCAANAVNWNRMSVFGDNSGGEEMYKGVGGRNRWAVTNSPSPTRHLLGQHKHRDVPWHLIAPYELHKELTEGTLFSAQITLHTYIFSGNPTSNKVYHIYVEKLKVLDRGYGAPWKIPIPILPTAGPSSPNKRKGADWDDTADDAFNAFSSISPKKKL